MTARCPAGHDSTELDYCSVCGAAMSASATGATAPRPSAGASGACPACGEPRSDPDARFCEVCRYDFVAGRPGPAPRSNVAPPAAAPTPAPAPPPVSAKGAPAPAAYVLVVQVDPTLDVDPDPSQKCPAGSPDVSVDVDRAEVLVGRRDDLRDVHPDVPLADPGTSRRHAKFVKGADGSLALVDLASTNGTKLNGVDVAAGSRSPLSLGDEVTLGRWTRIRVESKS